jgi:histone deacetylase complex subunit SAP18
MKYENKFQNVEINREKVCPFLVKVFFRENERNSFEEMNKGNFPNERELNIYTWMDCNLRELSKY